MRLASGGLTDIYFDLKPTMLDQEAGNLLAEELLDLLRGDSFDSIGGLAVGAVPLVQAVVLKSYGHRLLRAFFVRSEVKEHGTKERIEANFRDGDRVIILDDVTTTGGSVLKAVEAVRSRGADVLKVITVVDRQEGAREALKARGIEFVSLFTKEELQC
jgi:orotate phosphoribosyltransferase